MFIEEIGHVSLTTDVISVTSWASDDTHQFGEPVSLELSGHVCSVPEVEPANRMPGQIGLVFVCIASPQQGDLRLLGPPPGQGADGGARTCVRRVPADLRADSPTTEPPTPPFAKRGMYFTLCCFMLHLVVSWSRCSSLLIQSLFADIKLWPP
ncbi:hypothetical protein PoB_001272500 [Plakobranchus ocellatus]|uniref:Uncharacterized protein n=1 Tax=Plakobranchus ocellatus TaxID=259542 RepID=A0AAV3YTT4_9GAST|nr:hypothetical protein PoB_001272500 [Plakobranchus ocellatus]